MSGCCPSTWRVLAQRDGSDVADVAGADRGESREAGPAHARVDVRGQRAGTVGVHRDRGDLGRRVAVCGRGDVPGQRPGTDPLLARAGVRGGAGRVVGVAAAEELEPGRQVGLDGQRASRMDRVVLEVQRVDGLVVMRAAQELALRAALLDVDGDAP